MNLSELDYRIFGGEVKAITLTREFCRLSDDPKDAPGGAWTPWEMRIQYADGVGLASRDPWLMKSRNSHQRQRWERFGTAYNFARRLGWTGPINVEDRCPHGGPLGGH